MEQIYVGELRRGYGPTEYDIWGWVPDGQTVPGLHTAGWYTLAEIKRAHERAPCAYSASLCLESGFRYCAQQRRVKRN